MSIEIDIRADGTARDLSLIAQELHHAVIAGIEDKGDLLVRTTAALTPKGPGPQGPDDPLPHISETFSTAASGDSVAIVSSHPGAIVHEFGGTIAPNGAPITIRESAMAHHAVEQDLPQIEESVERRIDRLIR